jgi:hypothetical protein
LPEARCGPPKAKIRVQHTTKTNQKAMLVGLPMASETQFANLRKGPGGLSISVGSVGSMSGFGVVIAVLEAVNGHSNPRSIGFCLFRVPIPTGQ